MRINLWRMRGPAYDRPARTTLMKVTTLLLLAFSLPPRAQLALTLLLSLGLLTGGLLAASVQTAGERPRARELGIRPGSFDAGPLNAITDVPDLRVGQVTLIEGDRVRTGVTAIVPHGGNLFQDKVSGAVFVGNAFGKLAGSTQVDELGTIETPIVLTNTLAVGTAMEAVVRYTLAQPGNEQVRSVNALVGETNDGALNDIRALPVTGAHVRQAIDRATSGPVEEGAVGAGTGTICYGWKGGIGTASRRVPLGRGEGSGAAARAGAGAASQVGYTLGVIVQTNFGGNLTIDGVPVWKTLGHAAFPRPADTVAHALEDGARATDGRTTSLGSLRSQEAEPASPDGSCMIVIATDAPLSPRDLQRLAARGVFALGRTGSSYSHGSGDFAIAFSTAPDARVKFGETAPRAKALLPSEAISPLFQAALEATEEAVYNSLFRAQTMTGSGRTIEAIPIDDVRTLLGNRR
jgi:D-aminopeptidase